MNPTAPTPQAGIAVSKGHLDVFALPKGDTCSVANDQECIDS